MVLKIRILTPDGNTVSASSTTEELLSVLVGSQTGVAKLSQDEEDSLRGWLIVRAEELNKGEMVALDETKTVCIGKTADGRSFIRDLYGDWPPVKPYSDPDPFA